MKALLVSLALATCTVASASPGLTPAAAYADACLLSRYSCKGIRQPWVRESIFVDKAGALGMYFGGRTIWVSPGLRTDPKMHYIVLVHEMVHYLQVYADEKGFPHRAPFENCIREEEAYEISDKIAARFGLVNLLRLDQVRATCT